jgi:large repetitive protein
LIKGVSQGGGFFSYPALLLSAANSAYGTITDDDAVTISVNDVSVMESNRGSRLLTFTVTLSGPSSRFVTVKYQTADGTTTAPDDYTAEGPITLSFGHGQTSKTVKIYVKGDAAVEPNETFFLNLSGAVEATISDAQGLGAILNDDSRTEASRYHVLAALVC